MSEPIPESVPTSADPRSRRPLKKTRITNPNAPAMATQKFLIDNLMLEPDRPIHLPSASKSPDIPAPPEIVANVQGSSAGAGSGEFHVYKASRRREYERLRVMGEEARKEGERKEWEEKKEEVGRRDEEKTERRRRARERRRKKAKGKDGGNKVDEEEEDDDDDTQTKGEEIRPPGAVLGSGGQRKEGHGVTNDVGVAKLVEENGITIHDDD